MKSSLKYMGAGILLLLLLCSAPGVYAQDFSDLVSFFNSQFIPVEEINVENGSVVVRYSMQMTLGPEEFGQDILYIFGKITKEFPSSDTIRIECLVGEEIVFKYEISTKDVLDYVNGKIGDEEIISKIKVEDFISYELYEPERPVTLGDGDGDGLCTEFDAQMAMQMAIGQLAEDLKMDVDQDGRVTESDAFQILEWAATGGQCRAGEGEERKPIPIPTATATRIRIPISIATPTGFPTPTPTEAPPPTETLRPMPDVAATETAVVQSFIATMTAQAPTATPPPSPTPTWVPTLAPRATATPPPKEAALAQSVRDKAAVQRWVYQSLDEDMNNNGEQDFDDNELYVRDQATGQDTRLTHNQFGDALAAWSPSGELIAFVSNRDGDRTEIYIMARDGSNPVRLTSDRLWDGWPNWAPSGQAIFYLHATEPGVTEKYEIRSLAFQDGRPTAEQTILNLPPADDYGGPWFLVDAEAIVFELCDYTGDQPQCVPWRYDLPQAGYNLPGAPRPVRLEGDFEIYDQSAFPWLITSWAEYRGG